MKNITRRDLLQRYFCPSAIYLLSNCSPFRSSSSHLQTNNNQVVDIAQGFTYHVVQQAGRILNDGNYAPGKPDGMGAFKLDEHRVILLCNHELDYHNWFSGANFSLSNPLAFDPLAPGGVSRMVWNTATNRLEYANMVLLGTIRNCAGGYSPWGWLSCEETLTKGHGYVFLCNPHATKVTNPKILPYLGRFNHEAAICDPISHITYLTEDRHDGCFYRLVPKSHETPFVGQLQALKVKGSHSSFDTSNNLTSNQLYEVSWVNVNYKWGDNDRLRYGAHNLGAAIFSRGEGIALHDNKIYFACTSGGQHKLGQIFGYYPRDNNYGQLELIYEATSKQYMQSPDNITITPWGDLYIAEDSRDYSRIILLNKKGNLFTLAQNKQYRSEFAGVCFSSDYSTLFANLQHAGLTIAITGDFKKLSAL